MKIRATLVELWRRFVEVKNNDKDKMYINGYNNLYPNETEGVINNSPTAFRCAQLMAKYIEGKGILNDLGELLPYSSITMVNEAKNYRLTDVISLASKSIAYQYGVYFHVIYGISDDGKKVIPVGLDVLDYVKCRKSKEDDEDYNGMIIYKDFEKSTQFGKKDNTRKFYPFNSNQEILKAQIWADADGSDAEDLFEAIKHFRGQVFYLNLNPEKVYASSLLDSVYNDADTEYRIGLYNNTQSRTGFVGKTIFLTQGLDEEESEEVKKDLASFMGAQEASNLYHMDVVQTDSLDNVLKVIQLEPQFDDKLYSETKKSIRENILGAFNNVPTELVLAGDGALFGSNSDKYKELKIFYSEQNEYEREQLERAFAFMGFPIKIEPIAKRDLGQVSDKTADSQAALKGSVGGVTALIEIQKSVSQGFTQRESAIEIVKTIYGIDEETANIMVGMPIDTEELTLEGADAVQ